jgi:hypothetical protein
MLFIQIFVFLKNFQRLFKNFVFLKIFLKYIDNNIKKTHREKRCFLSVFKMAVFSLTRVALLNRVVLSVFLGFSSLCCLAVFEADVEPFIGMEPIEIGYDSMSYGDPISTGQDSVECGDPVFVGQEAVSYGDPISMGDNVFQYGDPVVTGHDALEVGDPVSLGRE